MVGVIVGRVRKRLAITSLIRVALLHKYFIQIVVTVIVVVDGSEYPCDLGPVLLGEVVRVDGLFGPDELLDVRGEQDDVVEGCFYSVGFVWVRFYIWEIVTCFWLAAFEELGVGEGWDISSSWKLAKTPHGYGGGWRSDRGTEGG